MKWIKRVLRVLQVFSVLVFSTVLLDTFVLGARLKHLWIAIANTTSSSPFSTDGQSNYVLLFVVFIVILLIYIAFKLLGKDKEKV